MLLRIVISQNMSVISFILFDLSSLYVCLFLCVCLSSSVCLFSLLYVFLSLSFLCLYLSLTLYLSLSPSTPTHLRLFVDMEDHPHPLPRFVDLCDVVDLGYLLDLSVSRLHLSLSHLGHSLPPDNETRETTVILNQSD